METFSDSTPSFLLNKGKLELQFGGINQFINTEQCFGENNELKRK